MMSQESNSSPRANYPSNLRQCLTPPVRLFQLTRTTLCAEKCSTPRKLYSSVRGGSGSIFFRGSWNIELSRVLGPGDVILLISGGHGFEVLEELNMVEVKQGPYAGETDKTRFPAVLPEKLKFD